MSERNFALYPFPAVYDGHRSVRLRVDGADIGLATTTYSYQLTHEERAEVAQRIALMWNLLREVPTEALESALASLT